MGTKTSAHQQRAAGGGSVGLDARPAVSMAGAAPSTPATPKMKVQSGMALRRHWSWDLLQLQEGRAKLTPAPKTPQKQPPAATQESKDKDGDDTGEYSYSYYSGEGEEATVKDSQHEPSAQPIASPFDASDGPKEDQPVQLRTVYRQLVDDLSFSEAQLLASLHAKNFATTHQLSTMRLVVKRRDQPQRTGSSSPPRAPGPSPAERRRPPHGGTLGSEGAENGIGCSGASEADTAARISSVWLLSTGSLGDPSRSSRASEAKTAALPSSAPDLSEEGFLCGPLRS